MRTPLLLAALVGSATPALACVPPMPGEVAPVPPTDAERAVAIHRRSDQIVYAVVVREADERSDWKATIRILHSYKGTLKPGTTLPVANGYGFDPPPCFGMIGQMPLLKGQWGVIAFTADRPEWNVVEDRWLRPMFASGLIAHARRQRVGTGSTPE